MMERLPRPGPVSPYRPGLALDLPMATKVLQSFLWKLVQALFLQFLLQVRTP